MIVPVRNESGSLAATLTVLQGGRDDSEEKFNYVRELYESKKAELSNKDEQIRVLEEQVNRLGSAQRLSFDFTKLSQEAKLNYPELEAWGYSARVQTNFASAPDTVPVFEVLWKSGLPEAQMAEREEKLLNWLKVRLDDKAIALARAAAEE